MVLEKRKTRDARFVYGTIEVLLILDTFKLSEVCISDPLPSGKCKLPYS